MPENVLSARPARLRLPDVTVVAADCIHPQLAARALEICLDRADFGDAIILSDAPVAGRFRSEKIATLRTLDDYSLLMLREIPSRITTAFVLIVQWDGYLLDPSAWDPSFARYDYIGAPYVNPDDATSWVVGNGGFSLRSRKLLAALGAVPVVPGINEDRLICQTFRETLERDHGIRFAPERVANRFSFEARRPDGPTFGFHGVFNLHRAENDEEVLRMVSGLTPRETMDGRLFSLMNECLIEGRPELASRLFDGVRRRATVATLRTIVARLYGSAEFATQLIGQLQGLADATAK